MDEGALEKPATRQTALEQAHTLIGQKQFLRGISLLEAIVGPSDTPVLNHLGFAWAAKGNHRRDDDRAARY
jgi:hypothetical protein